MYLELRNFTVSSLFFFIIFLSITHLRMTGVSNTFQAEKSTIESEVKKVLEVANRVAEFRK